LYFHPLASSHEFSVANSVLKNESFCTSPDSFHQFKLLGNRGTKTQSSAEVFDRLTGVVFYTQINRDAVGCWNTLKPFTIENQGLVASDSELLVFPNDLRIDDEGNLLVLSNRMPIFIYSKLKPEFNFRILVGKTTDIIKGTPCEN
jgi:Major royal jelly protein